VFILYFILHFDFIMLFQFIKNLTHYQDIEIKSSYSEEVK